ncbi:unnamed protein product, partial [Rotaria sp. Silwood2]
MAYRNFGGVYEDTNDLKLAAEYFAKADVVE